jgi:CCR4-NOT transcription complex subunit 9
MDDPEVINFLLSTEIIPLCLRIMETGSELSKTVRSPSRAATACAWLLDGRRERGGVNVSCVSHHTPPSSIYLSKVATFIIQKILLDEMGLNYICATFERFSAVRILSPTPLAGRP